MERDNRKSHLAPQLSPATQELLRSSDSPTYHGDDRTTQTPTSGEIPIAGAIMSPHGDQQYDSISNRSPTRNGAGGLGRAGGQAVHPGLGRVATTNSIPKVTAKAAGERSAPASASRATFALPVRPAPMNAPPPPPPPKDSSDDVRQQHQIRRKATYGGSGTSFDGSYSSGYPTR